VTHKMAKINLINLV